MEHTDCLTCGEKSIFLFNKTYTYNFNKSTRDYECNFYKCTSCKCVFIYPQPNEQIIASSYTTDYECYNTSLNEIKYSRLKTLIAKWRFPEKINLKNICLKSTSIFFEVLTGKKITYTLGIPLNQKKSSKILEIGYGTGYWLEYMKSLNYKNLTGFDISDNMLNAKKLINQGIEIKNGQNINEVNWSNKFDIIRLEHVFEHVTEAKKLLIQINNILEDKGELVMTLPTIESFVKSGKFLKTSYDLDIPRHLFHYSKKSLNILLEETGFSNIKTSHVPVFRNFLHNIFLRYNWQVNRKDSVFIKLFIILFSPFYYLLCKTFKRGEFITVYAGKRN